MVGLWLSDRCCLKDAAACISAVSSFSSACGSSLGLRSASSSSCGIDCTLPEVLGWGQKSQRCARLSIHRLQAPQWWTFFALAAVVAAPRARAPVVRKPKETQNAGRLQRRDPRKAKARPATTRLCCQQCTACSTSQASYLTMCLIVISFNVSLPGSNSSQIIPGCNSYARRRPRVVRTTAS